MYIVILAKVIIMANFYPDTSQMSADRWQIYDMDDHKKRDGTVQRIMGKFTPVPKAVPSVQEIHKANGGVHSNVQVHEDVYDDPPDNMISDYEESISESDDDDEIPQEEDDPGEDEILVSDSQGNLVFNIPELFKTNGRVS